MKIGFIGLGNMGAPMAAKTRMADLRKARSGPVRKGSFAR